MKHIRTQAIVVVTSLLALPALAEEEHRQLDKHQHGHGTLNVAVESSTVVMALEVPGADIVGFEHEAQTDEQKSAIQDGHRKLEAVENLFRLPEAAGCKIKKAEVELDHDDHDEDHDHDKKTTETDHHDADSDEATHSEFHVSYEFSCADITQLKTIEFGYFSAFPGAQELDVTVVTGKGSSVFEATRDNPQINLGGII